MTLTAIVILRCASPHWSAYLWAQNCLRPVTPLSIHQNGGYTGWTLKSANNLYLVHQCMLGFTRVVKHQILYKDNYTRITKKTARRPHLSTLLHVARVDAQDISRRGLLLLLGYRLSFPSSAASRLERAAQHHAQAGPGPQPVKICDQQQQKIVKIHRCDQ